MLQYNLDSGKNVRGKNGVNSDGITAIFSDINTALFHVFYFPIDLVTILQFCQSIRSDNRLHYR